VCAQLRKNKSDEARTAKRFRWSRSSTDRQQFNEVRSVARDLIYKSRADVLKTKVIESAGNSKKMWNTARQLLYSTPVRTLSDEDCATMSGIFCQLFADMVARSQQENSEITQIMNQSLFQTSRPYTVSPLVAFADASPTDVLKVLSLLPNKTYLRLVTYLRHRCWNRAPTSSHLIDCPSH